VELYLLAGADVVVEAGDRVRAGTTVIARPRDAGGAMTPGSGVIIVPSALTLGNLFFGVWAMVAASRGDFTTAAWLIVLAGVADTLDGRVARITQTGSRFGAELDSLVDAISFGVAPALIIYHLFLQDGGWGWIAAFVYIAGAVIRLARFNVEQAGHAKVAFHGLPSPASGMTLATFYPFSQTTLLRGLPQHAALAEPHDRPDARPRHAHDEPRPLPRRPEVRVPQHGRGS
jgi:CDP-diacylglycerol--serine O-phosphatidyltransferase